MKVLLDTHALLWWLSDDQRLASKARSLIADPGNDILVSAASLWEIVVKLRVGKLEADLEAIQRVITRDGFQLLPITAAHLNLLVSLPAHHRDPFDHLLIAQAVAEDALLVSEDHNMPLYPVRLMSCSAA